MTTHHVGVFALERIVLALAYCIVIGLIESVCVKAYIQRRAISVGDPSAAERIMSNYSMHMGVVGE